MLFNNVLLGFEVHTHVFRSEIINVSEISLSFDEETITRKEQNVPLGSGP